MYCSYVQIAYVPTKKYDLFPAGTDLAVKLLIGSQVGINAKWISTHENVIADKISRLKQTNEISSTLPTVKPTYDYSKLQQEHEELKVCSSFLPSPKLLSLIWEILLTQKCPDLRLILSLRPQDLGKLCT